MVSVVLRGKEWPLLIDMRNAREMQERYKSLEDLPQKLLDLDELAWILSVCIREGVELDNEEHHKQDTPPSQDQIAKLLTFNDLYGDSGLGAAVQQAFLEFYGKNSLAVGMLEKVQQTVSSSKSTTLNDVISTMVSTSHG